MKKLCVYCNKEYDGKTKKCPICGKSLKNIPTEEEIRKQNDDMVAINTMMPM